MPQWTGLTLNVDHRCAEDILQGMTDAGLTVR
jgi:hypothetical protein